MNDLFEYLSVALGGFSPWVFFGTALLFLGLPNILRIIVEGAWSEKGDLTWLKWQALPSLGMFAAVLLLGPCSMTGSALILTCAAGLAFGLATLRCDGDSCSALLFGFLGFVGALFGTVMPSDVISKSAAKDEAAIAYQAELNASAEFVNGVVGNMNQLSDEEWECVVLIRKIEDHSAPGKTLFRVVQNRVGHTFWIEPRDGESVKLLDRLKLLGELEDGHPSNLFTLKFSELPDDSGDRSILAHSISPYKVD